MPRPKLNFTVLDHSSGRSQPGAWVSIYFANSLTPATLWADDDVSTLPNPVQANQLGQVAMRVNPGLYDVSMTWDGAQPTVVEDVLAWTPEGAVLSAQGDLIVGGIGGHPERLPLGPPGTVLQPINGTASWQPLSSSVGLPAVYGGGLLTFGNDGYLLALQPGTQDQALAMMGGMPTWVSTLLPPGTTLPISQPGDLVVGAAGTGLPARLARGETDAFLSVDATGGLVWTPAASMSRGRVDGLLAFAASGPAMGQLSFQRYYGTQVWIDGRLRTIPETSIFLPPTGLAADTLYHIYAAWVAPSTMILEASTTGPAWTTGLAHKAGDESRTLVGMARTIAGPAWVDSPKQRFVQSAAHQQPTTATAFLTAHRTITATTPTEVHSEIRAEFLAWHAGVVVLSVSGAMTCNTAGPTIWSTVAVDGTSVTGHARTPMLAGETMNIAASTSLTLSPGYHVLSLFSFVGGSGSVTFHGDANGYIACRTSVYISGGYSP
jgi:hypothetical protein